MKPILLVVIFAAAILGVVSLYYMSTHFTLPDSQTSYRVLHIGSEALTVEVVDTEPLRTRGLSGRATLSPVGGMFFIFDTDNPAGIWMKEMKFSIDIIWMDKDGTVISVKENATPDSYPEVFLPTQLARYVLEIPAGYAREHGVAKGTKVQL